MVSNHICFVARNYDAPHMGGRNPSLRYISEELRNKGYKVTIISTPYYKENSDKLVDNNIHYTKYQASYYLTLALAVFLLYNKIVEINQNNKISLLHGLEREFAGISCLIAKIRYKIPYVQWAYDRGFQSTKSDLLNSKSSIPVLKFVIIIYLFITEYIVMKYSDKVLTIGHDITNLLISRGFDPNNIIYIGNTVDGNKFHPDVDINYLYDTLQIKPEELIISYVGRISENKGTELFLQAAMEVLNEHKNIKFLIIGNDKDNYKSECIQYIEKEKSNHILWIEERPDIPQILNLTDILIIPVRKVGGGIGNILLEGMSSGTAVIQSAVAGAPYVVNNWKNGILFEDGNIMQISKSIDKLIANPTLLHNISKEARHTVIENYLVDKITLRLIKVYQDLIRS